MPTANCSQCLNSQSPHLTSGKDFRVYWHEVVWISSKLSTEKNTLTFFRKKHEETPAVCGLFVRPPLDLIIGFAAHEDFGGIKPCRWFPTTINIKMMYHKLIWLKNISNTSIDKLTSIQLVEPNLWLDDATFSWQRFVEIVSRDLVAVMQLTSKIKTWRCFSAKANGFFPTNITLNHKLDSRTQVFTDTKSNPMPSGRSSLWGPFHQALSWKQPTALKIKKQPLAQVRWAWKAETSQQIKYSQSNHLGDGYRNKLCQTIWCMSNTAVQIGLEASPSQVAQKRARVPWLWAMAIWCKSRK